MARLTKAFQASLQTFSKKVIVDDLEIITIDFFNSKFLVQFNELKRSIDCKKKKSGGATSTSAPAPEKQEKEDKADKDGDKEMKEK